MIKRIVYQLFTKKITIAKWQLNLFGVIMIGSGLIAGFYLALTESIPAILATAETTITRNTDNHFEQGTLTSTEVSGSDSSAVIQLEGGGGADWYSGSWQYRKEITIDKDNVDDNLTNFPVLISIDSDSDLAEEAQDDFDDILFADTSKTKLDHEIEKYDADTGELIAWVEVSSLSSSSDTTIYLYYGNGSCENQENASGVWHDDYKMVQHMNDFTTSSIEDSTANNNDGTKKTSNEPSQVEGKIGYSQDFSGDDFIDLPNDLGYTTEFSVFAWFKAEGTAPGSYHIVFGGQELEISIPQSSGEIRTGLRTNTRYVSNHGSGLLDGEWHLIGYTFDGSTKRSYIDGNYVGQQNVNGTLTYNFSYRRIGRYGSSSTYYANGVIDEARVTANKLTGEWISTAFNNQDSPSTFYQLGGEESALASSGTWISPSNANVIDLVWNGGWGDGTDESTAFSATVANVGENSSITFEARVAETTGGLSSASYKNLGTASSGTNFNKTKSELDNLGLTTGDNRYVQVKVSFSSTDGVTNPQLDSLSLTYLSDNTEPINPTGTSGYNSSSQGTEINSSSETWYSYSQPYFFWEGAEDNQSGIDGYYVYFGTDETASPETAGSYQTTDSYTASSLTSGETYYLRIKAKDVAGQNADGIYDGFTYKYDATAPENPSGLSAPQTYQSQIENITVYWATTGTSGPTDNDSEVAGYQYRIGDSGTWYGSSHTGDEDSGDLIPAGVGYYTLDTDYDELTEGENTFYLRTWDNAGNVSDSAISAILKYSGNAPSEPNELTVTPTVNDENSFGFSWTTPTTYDGQASGLSYCYTINAVPSSTNCTWTSETSLTADAYATQPSTNTLYVVAKDEAGNVNYDAYASINFDCDTSAPGVPRNMDIADISIKATSNWKLAISWDEPEATGAGVTSYKIYQSITVNADCSNSLSEFEEIGSTGGTSYSDTGLSQTDYYYCAKACDSANNCSAVSSTVTGYPDGKFTEPAGLTAGPTVSGVTTKKATISWSTDRTADSKIQYGTGSGDYYDEEVSSSTHTTDHSITLTNLSAGQTYYYRAKWTDEDGNTGMSEEKTFTTDPAPSLSAVEATDIGLTSAYINFTISNSTKAAIQYGETTSYGGLTEVTTSTTESSYSVQLTGLADGTKYHYRIIMEDSEGEEYISDNYTDLETLPRPRISTVRLEEITGSAQPAVLVSWQTNTAISSILTYYPTDNPGQAKDKVNIQLKQGEHRMLLKDLLPDKTYVLVVKGRDKVGNEAESDQQTFTTATDTRPPVIGNLKVEGTIQGTGEEAKAQLLVSFNTDEPATSQVEFGEGTGTTYSQKTQEDADLTNNHLVIVPNLSPSKVYHLRAIAKDKAGNETKSVDTVSITPKATESALNLVITNLSEVFGFLSQ